MRGLQSISPLFLRDHYPLLERAKSNKLTNLIIPMYRLDAVSEFPPRAVPPDAEGPAMGMRFFADLRSNSTAVAGRADHAIRGSGATPGNPDAARNSGSIAKSAEPGNAHLSALLWFPRQ